MAINNFHSCYGWICRINMNYVSILVEQKILMKFINIEWFSRFYLHVKVPIWIIYWSCSRYYGYFYDFMSFIRNCSTRKILNCLSKFITHQKSLPFCRMQLTMHNKTIKDQSYKRMIIKVSYYSSGVQGHLLFIIIMQVWIAALKLFIYVTGKFYP